MMLTSLRRQLTDLAAVYLPTSDNFFIKILLRLTKIRHLCLFADSSSSMYRDDVTAWHFARFLWLKKKTRVLKSEFNVPILFVPQIRLFAKIKKIIWLKTHQIFESSVSLQTHIHQFNLWMELMKFWPNRCNMEKKIHYGLCNKWAQT